MAKLRKHGTEHQLRLAADNVRVGIAHCDTECRYTFVNRHWAERFCVTPEQVVGRHIPEIAGEEAWRTCEHYVRECLAGNATEFELEYEFPYRPGERQFMHCCCEPEWRNGKVVGL